MAGSCKDYSTWCVVQIQGPGTAAPRPGVDRGAGRAADRCIGAQSKDVRRVFSSEGLFLAFLRWVVGVPLGFVVYQIFVAAFAIGMKLTMPDKFALIYVAWSLVLAVVGTLIVIFFPLRRATSMKPGDAIRYE